MPHVLCTSTQSVCSVSRKDEEVVTNSGDWGGSVVYSYVGQSKGTMSQIIEPRDGSENLYQQFIHGTPYTDKLVMVRVADKGDLYVHQDANSNVIGLTDLGGSLVELLQPRWQKDLVL